MCMMIPAAACSVVKATVFICRARDRDECFGQPVYDDMYRESCLLYV
jgi:hypothetical protein